MSRAPVTRLGRVLDIVSLALVVAGGLLFWWAFAGMLDLRDQRLGDFVPGTTEAFAALNKYYGLQRLSYAGAGLAAIGIGVALSAAWHNRKFSKEEGADHSLRSG